MDASAQQGDTGTADPEIYRHGMHAHEFTAYFTVAPGAYDVRIHFAETREDTAPADRKMNITINGEVKARDLDIAETAGGFRKAYQTAFEQIRAQNGMIAIQFTGSKDANEAIAQAIEVCPVKGAEPAARH